jgi:hypothetical protein
MKRSRSENSARSRRVKQQLANVLSQAYGEDSDVPSDSGENCSDSTIVDSEDFETPTAHSDLDAASEEAIHHEQNNAPEDEASDSSSSSD